jgi:hypothetical protein
MQVHVEWHGKVVRTRNGSLAIETKARDWQERFTASLANPDLPYPMPQGHLIFKRPQDYGATLLTPKRNRRPLCFHGAADYCAVCG